MSQMRDLLLDVAAQLFAEAVEPEIQEAVEAGRFPAGFWDEVDENGLPSALLPEEQEGAGVGLGDALAVLRVAGAFALPVPLAETLLGRFLLFRAGMDVPQGPLNLALGSPSCPLTYERKGGGLSLSGTAVLPWPAAVKATVAVARGSEGDVVALLPPRLQGGEEREVEVNVAGEPQARITWDGTPLEDSVCVAAPADLGYLETLRCAAAGRTALMAGAMDRILELTLEHARGRVQFGRPIARFQALQHQIAAMAGEVAVVGVAADAAALALTTGDGALEVAVAKARASEAVARVSKVAHQVHGAIGYTREHTLHRFTRRLWAWREDYGDESYWQGQVGELACEAGRDGIWDLLSKPPA